MSNVSTARQTQSTPVSELFGIDAPKAVVADKFVDDQNPHIPKLVEHYVFRREFVREVLAYIQKPHDDAMLAFGHTGSGKSSGFNQLLARMNYPTEEVTCHEDMRYSDLIGQFVMKALNPGEAPQMSWVDGPLTRAVRNGHALILNEWDLMEPGELAGLNDLLDGRPLMISENGGEIVHADTDFRLFATGNSAGAGDEMGLYQSVKTQNLAAMDRYRVIEVDYPTPEVENDILARVTPKLAPQIREGMVKVANEIRYLFKGENPDVQLGITMSTRVLRRWALLTMDFKGAKNSSSYALDIALLRRADKEEREAVTRICKDVFGDIWI